MPPPRSTGSDKPSACCRTARRRSSCPRTRSSWRRFATSLGCIWIRRNGRWCCASTRRTRSRRWIAVLDEVPSVRLTHSARQSQRHQTSRTQPGHALCRSCRGRRGSGHGNYTPKIAALLLVFGSLDVGAALTAVGAFIALGGLISARRVAETMALKVTDLNAGQGLTANLCTTGIVLGASWLALPVSTTHVSCGSLFGIGAASGQARWRTIATILTAWVTTLPLAAILGWLAFFVLDGRV